MFPNFNYNVKLQLTKNKMAPSYKQIQKNIISDAFLKIQKPEISS